MQVEVAGDSRRGDTTSDGFRLSPAVTIYGGIDFEKPYRSVPMPAISKWVGAVREQSP